MNTCGACPGRPAGNRAPKRRLERAPVAVSHDGRHLDSVVAGALTRAGKGRVRWLEQRRVFKHGSLFRRWEEVSEGSSRRRHRGQTTPRRFFLRGGESRAGAGRERPCEKKVVDRPKASRCAVKRVAVGGRMTARWSGAAQRRGESRESRSGLEVERWRVSHGARQTVSKMGVSLGCS